MSGESVFSLLLSYVRDFRSATPGPDRIKATRDAEDRIRAAIASEAGWPDELIDALRVVAEWGRSAPRVNVMHTAERVLAQIGAPPASQPERDGGR